MKQRIHAAVIGLALSGGAASARPVVDEPSKYGKFELKTTEDCRVSFRATDGKVTDLLTIEACQAEGLSGLEAVDKVGKVKLPAGAGADEVHLFSILTARGGNACDGYDYYVVVVNAGKAWAGARSIGGCATLEDAKPGKGSLTFIVPSSTTVEGASYEVSMGQVKTKTLPKKPRSLKSTKQVVLTGSYSSGAGFTNHRPYLDGGKDPHIIDDPGKCALEKLEDGGQVTMTAEEKRWSDGERELTCLSITPAK